MANELLIQINADAKNAVKAFDDIQAKSEDLTSVLDKTALVAGAAFAAFSAEIFFSVKAFAEANAASLELSNALQNQGIFTNDLKNKYKEFADVVQAKTGIDNDAIIKAQAIAQTYLGQTAVTQELTSAIADLGAKMGGDLNGAAEKIGRTIGTSTNAFARQGLQLSETATTAERYTKVLELVRTQAGGLAEEFNKANGYSKALETAFGNLQEEIGSRFFPVIAGVRKIFVDLFTYISESPVLVDLGVAFIAAGVVVTGLVTAIAVAIPAFAALTAAAAALGVGLNLALVGIPAAIGLVVGAITLLALNWDKAVASVKAISVGLITFMTESFAGLGKVLTGAFELDLNKIKSGLDQVKGAFTAAKNDTIATFQEVTASQKVENETQNADKAAAAAKAAAKEKEHQANLRNIQAQEIELIKLQNENASADLIALKGREIETLKALDQEKTNAEIEVLNERRAIILALEDQQKAEDLERLIAFTQVESDTKAELAAQGIEVEGQLREAQIAQIQAQAMSEDDIDRKLQSDILTRRIAGRNQELLDRKKYGEAISVINKFITSEEVKAVATASSDLVQLQQSKSQTLKEIGKAAAVADITISTAQAAMRIYTGFATIPIIGPALGVAGAAAAIAFGAERIGQVTSAADGGLITGGVPGKDSVPAMLMPGELVVPTKNFDQVVGAVQNDGSNSSPEMLDTLKTISDKLDNVGGYTFNGDISTDETFVDNFVKKISDAVQYRNAKIYGVNA